MKTFFLTLALLPALAGAMLVLASCGKEVKRLENNEVRYKSGNWNDTMSRETAEKISSDPKLTRWADEYADAHNGTRPVIKVGKVLNKTTEEIATGFFVESILKSLLDRGKVRAVAASDETDQARQERIEQDKHATAETRKEAGQEIGTDFLLIGTIKSQIDQEEDEAVKAYSVDLKLTDVKTQELVWIGNYKCKLEVKR